MTDAVTARSRSGRLLLLFSLGSSVVFVALAVRRLQPEQVWQVLGRAQLWPWLPLAVLSYIAGHWVRGWRCKLLVGASAPITTRAATEVVVVGYATNNLLPARLGELARSTLLARRTGLALGQALTVTFVERVLDGVVLSGLLLVAWSAAPHVAWVGALLRVGAMVFGGAASLVLLAVAAPGWLLAVTARVARPLGPRLAPRLLALSYQVTSAVAYLRQPSAALRSVSLSLVVWLLESGLFLALLPALGLAPSWPVALLAMTVTNLGILVPSSPGFIGTFHFFCQQALTAVGVGATTALVFAVLVHAAFFVPVTLWGVAILAQLGLGWGSTVSALASARPAAQQLEELLARPAPAPPRAPAPSAFVQALVEALVPEDDHVPPSAHALAVAESAAFTAEALSRLPARLKLLFGLGTLGFRVLTWLRFLRPYSRLPLARRRRWTEAVAYGRLTLLRQLFRAPRSTALVAYYGSAGVRAALEGR